LSDTPTLAAAKADDAFRTIGELADELNLPQHILRYWETRFPQLRPLQRAGKRRYYRPADAALVRRIDRLLNHEGYTIRGVQKLLDAKAPDEAVGEPAPAILPSPPAPQSSPATERALPSGPSIDTLRAIRDSLTAALRADA
jgi:DNA-binding transcriptional MerR regulator